MSKKKRRPNPPAAVSIPKQLITELSEANRLMTRGRVAEAVELLRSLEQAYPNRAEVLAELVNACYELKDFAQHMVACERLLRLRPDDPDVMMVLVGSYMVNMRPALALRTLHRFRERWPSHERD